MFDATDLEYQRREHVAEMGAESAGDRAWSRFYDAADKAIRAAYGVSLDGDDHVDGFSIDGAYVAFERGHTVAAYMLEVALKREELEA